MNKESRLLLSAVTVAVYALVMFTAAGFFYTNYQDLMRSCSRFSYSDCHANDAIVVSAISIKTGTAVFFLMGACAWMAASYIGFRFVRIRAGVRLP